MAFENMGSEVVEEKGLDWDSTIAAESDFILASPGDYDFKVIGFERQRYNGGDKLPACNMALLTIEIQTLNGAAHIMHRLYLHTKTEGMLSSFFIGIGQKKHGEALKMDWSKVIGATGRCKVTVNSYNGKDYNNISKFYDPTDKNAVATDTATKSFVPGKF